jgi:hypothetical protein
MRNRGYRRLLACTALLAFAATATLAQAKQPALPFCDLPMIVTSCGQSPDAKIVSLLSERISLKHTYNELLKADEMTGFKTLILVVGGSGKGLGAAGIEIPDELARCDKLLAKARAAKMYVIGMHIGGVDRRGPTSTNFLPYAAKVDYLIVKEDGNEDGYFTKLAAERKIPLYIVKQTMEVADVLKAIFKVK